MYEPAEYFEAGTFVCTSNVEQICMHFLHVCMNVCNFLRKLLCLHATMCVVRPVVCVSTAFLLEGRAFTMFVVLIVSRVDAPRF